MQLYQDEDRFGSLKAININTSIEIDMDEDEDTGSKTDLKDQHKFSAIK